MSQPDQLTKNQRKKLKRQQREQQARQMKRKALAKKWGIRLAITLSLAAAGAWFVQSQVQQEQNRPGEDVVVMGRQHVQVGASHGEYNTNPPTSGWHYTQPADGGFYDQPIPDEQAIHNLEHGYIWITYKQQSDEVIDQLKKLAKRYRGRVIVSPREENDSPIAVASWGRLLKLDQFDQEQIEQYLKLNYNRSPERLAS